MFLCIALLINAIKRRLGDINHATIDKRLHVVIEERKQKDLDVCAIGIGIGHDDDLAIMAGIRIELIAKTSTNSLD